MAAPLFAILLETSPVWTWLRRIGGPGLILLGIADNSVVPLPGSMDALTIVLAASNKERWWLYAVWATAGALVGGFLTYRLGEKGGEETLEKKFPGKKVAKVRNTFKKYGFWSLFVGAILPPPVPYSPFLVAGGAMEYPKKRFAAAVGSGRLVRYMVVAWIAHLYGRSIFNWLSRYYKPVLFILIGIGVVGGIFGVRYYLKQKRKAQKEMREDGQQREPHPKQAA